MLSFAQVLIWSAILTSLMMVVASLLWTGGITPTGLRLAFSNRESMPPQSPLAGRAERAARNMVEHLAIFLAVMLAVQITGRMNDLALLGANVFFWARVLYWPAYLAGIIYVRSALWGVSLVGLVLIVVAIW